MRKALDFLAEWKSVIFYLLGMAFALFGLVIGDIPSLILGLFIAIQTLVIHAIDLLGEKQTIVGNIDSAVIADLLADELESRAESVVASYTKAE